MFLPLESFLSVAKWSSSSCVVLTNPWRGDLSTNVQQRHLERVILSVGDSVALV